MVEQVRARPRCSSDRPQSLCHALQDELSAYYRLIAVLEGRAARPIEPLADAPDKLPTEGLDLAHELDVSGGLTLRRLVVWTDESRLRLRLMAVLIDGCTTAHGGALVSLLHSYTSHGDPFVRQLTDSLLVQVSRPFFRTLAKWIHEGELLDPCDEFFVRLNPELKGVHFSRRQTVDLDGGDGLSLGLAVEDPAMSTLRLWERKYFFRAEMLPGFVSESFGRKVRRRPAG